MIRTNPEACQLLPALALQFGETFGQLRPALLSIALALATESVPRLMVNEALPVDFKRRRKLRAGCRMQG